MSRRSRRVKAPAATSAGSQASMRRRAASAGQARSAAAANGRPAAQASRNAAAGALTACQTTLAAGRVSETAVALPVELVVERRVLAMAAPDGEDRQLRRADPARRRMRHEHGVEQARRRQGGERRGLRAPARRPRDGPRSRPGRAGRRRPGSASPAAGIEPFQELGEALAVGGEAARRAAGGRARSGRPLRRTTRAPTSVATVGKLAARASMQPLQHGVAVDGEAGLGGERTAGVAGRLAEQGGGEVALEGVEGRRRRAIGVALRLRPRRGEPLVRLARARPSSSANGGSSASRSISVGRGPARSTKRWNSAHTGVAPPARRANRSAGARPARGSGRWPARWISTTRSAGKAST